jgi:chitin disaccharide deacetylase
MLIINADDLGRSSDETDAALHCFEAGRITSTTAMAFMRDSERAADLARAAGIDVGLHLNFDEAFTGARVPDRLTAAHEQTRAYLTRSKFAQLLYNPRLRRYFEYSYKCQQEEFERLYNAAPSHLDGHHHMHLCANLAFSNIIPRGTKVRPTFSFLRGEKAWLNRTYRKLLDTNSRRRYRLPDYFFDLSDAIRGGTLQRIARLATHATVELMSHPVNTRERDYLVSCDCGKLLGSMKMGSYSTLSD